jgi:hypothetical protein
LDAGIWVDLLVDWTFAFGLDLSRFYLVWIYHVFIWFGFITFLFGLLFFLFWFFMFLSFFLSLMIKTIIIYAESK